MVADFTAATAALRHDKTPHAAVLSAAYAAFASAYAAAGVAADIAGVEEPFPLLPLHYQEVVPSTLDVLTLSETAAYLKLSETQVQREAEGGRLKGRPVDSDWRFVREDVLNWVRTPPPLSRPAAWTPETQAECEREIAEIYAARKALGTVGDHYPDEGAE